MEIEAYKAEDLFEWITREGHDFTLLDVRNDEEFGRFKVEGPHLSKMINIPYVEFIEKEEESVAKVPVSKDEKIRIVCAKEGSAKYVAEILVNNGWSDVKILEGGIKTWGNMLAPKLVASDDGYKLYQFIRPGKASCSYGLLYEDEMVVFDPSRNTGFYQNFAKENGCKVVKTFETHLQADYISGSKQLSLDTGAKIIGNENDFKDAAFTYHLVGDHEVFRFSKGGPEIKAIHMPGHTPGSTSYLIDSQYLVTGDTLFILSIGRPDLGGKAEEWSKLLYNTLFCSKNFCGMALMGLFTSDAWATNGAPAAAPAGDPLASMILPIGLIVLFYFFLIRPQSKRHKQHKEMVAALQKGEEVVTTGGLLGKITSVGENFITLEISKDVSIHVQKNSVQAVMPKGTIKEQSGARE